MLWDVITLFPAMFSGPLDESIFKRARERGLVRVNLHNLRDFAHDRHKSVDDIAYGGGPGMVLRPEPLCEAVEMIKAQTDVPSYVICLTPRGRLFNQRTAELLSKKKRILLVCGHYEDFDQRFIDSQVDEEISIGDFILTGGELAAMTVMDSVTRLMPGVVGNVKSHTNDSFSCGMLDHPHYTRPEVFNGMQVPDVLLSGHHRNIHRWRLKASLRLTRERRPDLISKADLNEEAVRLLNEVIREDEAVKTESAGEYAKVRSGLSYYVALVHYPVYDKNGLIVSTAITNLDIHDISRISMTFGAESYYLVTPLQTQVDMANRIIDHWKTGYGAEYNRDRFEAFRRTFCVNSLREAAEKIKSETGLAPMTVFTSAKRYVNSVSFEECRMAIEKSVVPPLIIFGTGWGLADSLREEADMVLDPVSGRGDYNHLSVRAAAAIILSRLFG